MDKEFGLWMCSAFIEQQAVTETRSTGKSSLGMLDRQDRQEGKIRLHQDMRYDEHT
jgi:hypothetical protein